MNGDPGEPGDNAAKAGKKRATTSRLLMTQVSPVGDRGGDVRDLIFFSTPQKCCRSVSASLPMAFPLVQGGLA